MSELTTRSALIRLKWIIQQFRDAENQPLTATQLARKYEVSARTIHRDIAALKSLGCIITSGYYDGFDFLGYKMVHCHCPMCDQHVRNKESKPQLTTK
jgi:biotin operon repressor